jgi:hypothetical protein
MAQGRYNVLFLSNRNTARSIFAEAVMNRVGGQNFKGFSAGMHPAKELDPLVPEILRLARYPTDVSIRSPGRILPAPTLLRSISCSPCAIRMPARPCRIGRAARLPPIGAMPTR